MTKERIMELVNQMTLEEKAGMCSGGDFWHTKAVERLGIPAVMLSDGPYGLRKQDEKGDHLGVNDSIKAVCFPAGCATSTSFNRELMYKMGEVLGNECQAVDVSVILGPAVNVKRSPLCGRNFEYISEDPYVASELSTSYINGVQSKGVGTSIKHYLANSQETRRMSVDAVIDERALNEIYLASFEGAVKNAQPWTVMSCYNKVNGKYGSEHDEYLNGTLRDKWGFEGIVVSDWGAVNDRVEGVRAGMDLEMPHTTDINDRKIVSAVKNGELDEKVLDDMVARVLDMVFRYQENRDESAVFDFEADHDISRQIAEESMVLLKNEDNILPLKKTAKIAFIGKYARKPRFQGGGSSHINCANVTSALDATKGMINISFAEGFDDKEDVIDEKLMAEALEVAAKADVAVIFAGLPDAFESEGFDRTHIRMPECQNKLIEEIAKVQKNVIVVLHNGSVIEMPWLPKVKGVLEAYLGGEAVGSAVCNILFGDVNPSGRLAETFPLRLEDNPTYLNFPGGHDRVEYREGIFVGYRYYDAKHMPVLFPFGYGLSYTTFEYSNLKVDKTDFKDNEELTVTVDVTNTGSVAGKEVVQLYVADKVSTVVKPVKELRGFDKVELAPGETKTVTFKLGQRAWAYFNTDIHDWCTEAGEYEVIIAKSVAEPVLTVSVNVKPANPVKKVYHMNSLVGDLMENPVSAAIIKRLMDKFSIADMNCSSENNSSAEAMSAEMNEAMTKYQPLRAFFSFSGESFTEEEVQSVIDELNEKCQ